MKQFFILLSLHLILSNALAQVQLSGKVTDQKKMPLSGANVFIQDSCDGATADSLGNYRG